MKVGYARVSTHDQRLDLQIDALERANCDLIFADHGVSGALAYRPELDKALRTIGPGDELVVWKLDRLGRSVSHMSSLLENFQSDSVQFRSLTEGIDTATMSGKLVYHIFSAIGEFERDLIIERTTSGMRAARAKGTHVGRPRLLTGDDARKAFLDFLDGVPLAVIAKHHKVSLSTLRRAFIEFEVSTQRVLT